MRYIKSMKRSARCDPSIHFNLVCVWKKRTNTKKILLKTIEVEPNINNKKILTYSLSSTTDKYLIFDLLQHV